MSGVDLSPANKSVWTILLLILYQNHFNVVKCPQHLLNHYGISGIVFTVIKTKYYPINGSYLMVF